MRRFALPRITPTKVVPSLLAAALLATLVVVAPVTPQAADASTRWDATLDISFPVAGPVTFRDDYASARSGGARFHRATDIMAPEGASVHAAVGGTIRFITGIDSAVPSYGYMIRIDGDDGRTYNYIHLGRQNRGPQDAYAPGMRRGLRVERGQWIGINGCSGNASCSAPHLHFEIVADVNEPAQYRAAGSSETRMNPYNSLVAAQRRGDVPVGTGRFMDVRTPNTHLTAIDWLAEEGITLGCNPPNNTNFCPTASVTRQQMAAFLVRSMNLTKTSGVRFKDVPRGSELERNADLLATAGITRGCTKDSFCPRDNVTRQQMASFLVRAKGLNATSGIRFQDVPRGSGIEKTIDQLATEGITRGCTSDNRRFCPADQVTRQQMATFLYRSFK